MPFMVAKVLWAAGVTACGFLDAARARFSYA